MKAKIPSRVLAILLSLSMMLSNAATGVAVGVEAEIDETSQITEASEYPSSGDTSTSPEPFSEEVSENLDAEDTTESGETENTDAVESEAMESEDAEQSDESPDSDDSLTDAEEQDAPAEERVTDEEDGAEAEEPEAVLPTMPIRKAAKGPLRAAPFNPSSTVGEDQVVDNLNRGINVTLFDYGPTDIDRGENQYVDKGINVGKTLKFYHNGFQGNGYHD